MFVRTQGILAAAVGLFAIGCDAPTEPSDLRPDGPPDVLSVLVSNDATGLIEEATFCRPNDDKRPGIVGLPQFQGTVQICNDDLTKPADEVTDAVPTAWYVRIMFDELLDPSVEELLPINDSTGQPTGTSNGSLLHTQPVTLLCGGVEVDYDGYYSPSGNRFTWPLGPSLFIQPIDSTTIATGTECEVKIKSDVVTDKDGNPVPSDELAPGYKFSIAPLTVTSTDPAGVVDPTAKSLISAEQPITITFNQVIDPASVSSADFKLFKGVGADCTGGTEVPAASIGFFQTEDDMMSVADPTSVEIFDKTATGATTDPADPMPTGNFFTPSSTYRLELQPGASATDAGGGMGDITFPADADGNDITTICFDVDAAS